jgi:hypothetical protein
MSAIDPRRQINGKYRKCLLKRRQPVGYMAKEVNFQLTLLTHRPFLYLLTCFSKPSFPALVINNCFV